MKIESWEDVNKALRVMGKLKISTINAAVEFKRIVDGGQAAFDRVKLPVDKKYAELESAIKAFAARHKAECIGKTRTKKLSFGKVSWKLTPGAVQFDLAEGMVIMNLREQGHEDCIRTVEEVNKDAVQNLDEKELLKAGVTIKRSDNCNVNPDLEKIAEEVAA